MMYMMSVQAEETRKVRAPRNRTMTLTEAETAGYRERLFTPPPGDGPDVHPDAWLDRTVHGDTFRLLPRLPDDFADLIFADPPYNLNKTFNDFTFQKQSDAAYENWLHTWLPEILRILKPTGSFYLCGDWRSSPMLYSAAKEYFIPRNRITWEREKGRGAKSNWKNCSEDIWFFTPGANYTFDLESVKLRRKVIAPYVNKQGQPKDWQHTDRGKFRLTHPSNLWTDLTVPFWSMPENTDHPTQKPEKLMARVILAATHPGQIVLDPFLGSGTTSVVARKLGRRYVGIEQDVRYCCLAEKRLERADAEPTIQGYSDGVFWERNSAP